jgi:hypothetical protein
MAIVGSTVTCHKKQGKQKSYEIPTKYEKNLGQICCFNTQFYLTIFDHVESVKGYIIFLCFLRKKDIVFIFILSTFASVLPFFKTAQMY